VKYVSTNTHIAYVFGTALTSHLCFAREEADNHLSVHVSPRATQHCVAGNMLPASCGFSEHVKMLRMYGERKYIFKGVESSCNVMAHGYARKGKRRRNWRMEWVASTPHTTSEHSVSSITTTDAHTSAASS